MDLGQGCSEARSCHGPGRIIAHLEIIALFIAISALYIFYT